MLLIKLYHWDGYGRKPAFFFALRCCFGIRIQITISQIQDLCGHSGKCVSSLFFWQPQIHNKLIWLRAESYQAPAFHWLPAWPNWCLTVSLVVWRKSLCCTNPHRVTGGATHLQARIYILFVSPQKIIRPQRKQMATVNCPVGGASASLSLWTEAFKRISLFQQGVRQVFCSCAVSALGNQTCIICVLTADSPRLHKYLRNNPQPIRRGQTHSCNICGYNVLSVKKKKKILHSNQCLFTTVQRTQTRSCILHRSFFSFPKIWVSFEMVCGLRWKTRD